MRHLTLSEFATTTGVELSHHDVTTLRKVAPSIVVSPSPARPGLFDLTAGSHVGTIVLPALRILVEPKIAIHRLMFVLSYAVDPRHWRDVGFDFDEDRTIFEAIVPGFLFQLRRSLRRGLSQGYARREESSTTLRGRLRIDEQIRRRYGRAVPAEISFDDHTADVLLNQILKSAVRATSRLPLRSRGVRRQLRGFDALLADVSQVELDPTRLPDHTFTRLDEHYRPAIELAKLIMRGSSFTHRHGRVEAAAFLIDMNRVFEDFVVVALREALGAGPSELVQGGRRRPLYLDHALRVRLKPDLSWWSGRTCTFVGDVKYKRLNPLGSPNADLYQLLAYAIAADLPSAMLVYAAGEAPATAHDIPLAEKSLLVRTLDLGQPPDEVLRQVDDLALEIAGRRPTASYA